MLFLSRYNLQLALILQLADLSSAELVVNTKTRSGNIVKLSITDSLARSSITLEYQDWDLTQITQLVDYTSGFHIFKAVLWGELDLGQPATQTLCFVTHLATTDFIQPEAVSKLRQKNPDAIRTSENHLGMVFSSMDLVIDYDQSELISPYIKELCTNAQSAIYSRDSDIAKTAQIYNRDYEQMMSLTQKLTVFQLPRCSHANSMTQACSCHYQISIDWFPCSLKYCKSSDGNKQITYRCGIRTCGLTHMFEFPVKSRKACWWEWFQEFE